MGNKRRRLILRSDGKRIHHLKSRRMALSLGVLCICLLGSVTVVMAGRIAKDYPARDTSQWVRINQLGYLPSGVKVAVWCSKDQAGIKEFKLVDSATGQTVFTSGSGKNFGQYGPFASSSRLDFTRFVKTGVYQIVAGTAVSPYFKIDSDVYKGGADFCLFYLRQQRSGYNPFLKDSCHTHDGYTLYGPMADSTHIDVVGGWHDASDYLQYATTTANATWHLLAAYRDYPTAFIDKKQASGLDGSNGIADVLDEAKWGLDWLLKMHPKADWMFNQVADDRDHHGMRMPGEDDFYGKGFERPVYFIDGQPQQRGPFKNHTTGTSSTAAKLASAFSLGSSLFSGQDLAYSQNLRIHAGTAIQYALKKPGVTQTVSVVSPYIYAEDNWTDDMELGFASLASAASLNNEGADISADALLDTAYQYAGQEPVTPWMFRDTANHYQYYPFINLGHYELARQLKGQRKGKILSYYKKGIEAVWKRARQNAFYRGVPFIWCSNNLTTAFSIQCLWYQQLSGDNQFEELGQANFDWLFGCNPWGTSMVYGLPSFGDYPADPHSAFTHLKNYPIYGGLVDGPVYGAIFNGLIGIQLGHEDSYASFQSDLAVYHDDAGDYSTNEPTMDGTASLIYLLAAKASDAKPAAKENVKTIKEQDTACSNCVISHGAVIRGDTTIKKIALVFTADSFADGRKSIIKTLEKQKVPGSFFFTGNFFRDPANRGFIRQAKRRGYYMGTHSDKHLLYCDWENRDSTLVTHQAFRQDLRAAFREMKGFGIDQRQAGYFLPPYEWYNDSIACWAHAYGLQLVNFTPGTGSNADYTYPQMGDRYKSSARIMRSILDYEARSASGLNGFLLLTHFGTDPRRTDKFYKKLPALIQALSARGYQFVSIDQLLPPLKK